MIRGIKVWALSLTNINVRAYTPRHNSKQIFACCVGLYNENKALWYKDKDILEIMVCEDIAIELKLLKWFVKCYRCNYIQTPRRLYITERSDAFVVVFSKSFN